MPVCTPVCIPACSSACTPCMHPCLHPHVHPYLHLSASLLASLHASLLASLLASLCTCLHPCLNPCFHPCVHPCIHPCFYSCLYPCVHACLPPACIPDCIPACIPACTLHVSLPSPLACIPVCTLHASLCAHLPSPLLVSLPAPCLDPGLHPAFVPCHYLVLPAWCWLQDTVAAGTILPWELPGAGRRWWLLSAGTSRVDSWAAVGLGKFSGVNAVGWPGCRQWGVRRWQQQGPCRQPHCPLHVLGSGGCC